jgi:Fe-S-cluster-containing hydrogenase component 2
LYRKIIIYGGKKMVSVIRDKCKGCGRCVMACPEGIILQNGKAVIKNEKAACLKEAVDVCPFSAIKIKQ